MEKKENLSHLTVYVREDNISEVVAKFPEVTTVRPLTDENGIGELVDSDGLTFLVFEDYAVLTGVNNQVTTLKVPDYVIKGNSKIPVTYVASYSILNQSNLEHIILGDSVKELCSNIMSACPEYRYLTIGKSLKKMDSNSFSDYGWTFWASGFVNHEEDIYVSDEINRVYVCGIRNNIKKECSGNYAFFFIPGGTADNYSDIRVESKKEMWSYEIDKINGKVRILPAIDEIAIDRVTVNGEDVYAENGIYAYRPSEVVDITVVYTLFDVQTMSTHYDSDFNAAMPNMNLSRIELIDMVAPDEEITMYDTMGRIVYNGVRSSMPELSKGIYLLKTRSNGTRKVVI